MGLGRLSPGLGRLSPGLGRLSPGLGRLSPDLGWLSPGLGEAVAGPPTTWGACWGACWGAWWLRISGQRPRHMLESARSCAGSLSGIIRMV
jgi:hypothetical protein